MLQWRRSQNNVQFRFAIQGEVLRAELYRRETGEETRRFIHALAAQAKESGCTRALIVVRASRPIFKVDQYGITDAFRLMLAIPGARAALVGDSEALRASHEYIEVLASQQKVNLRSFHDEASALRWLASEPAAAPGRRGIDAGGAES